MASQIDAGAAVLGIDHVFVTVPAEEFDAAHAFYTDVLGLVENPKPVKYNVRRSFWLQTGATELHVAALEAPADRWTSDAHVALSVQGLDAFRERLTAAGVKVRDLHVNPGMRRFDFRDPYGNLIELIEHDAS